MKQRVRMVHPKLPGQPIWVSGPAARRAAGWVEEPEPEPVDDETETSEAKTTEPKQRRRRRDTTEGDN